MVHKKFTSVWVAFLMLPHLLFSSIDTIEVTSKITTVTVFFQGAQINRTSDISLTQGEYLIKLVNLPNEMEVNSINVEQLQNAKILAVKHQQKPLGKTTKEEIRIEDKIEALKKTIRPIQDQISVLEFEGSLLRKNSDFKKRDGSTNLEELIRANTFYKARFTEINQQKLALNRKIDAITKEVKKLQLLKEQIRQANMVPQKEIWVSLKVKEPVKESIRFSYLVTSAGWRPEYDFRIQQVNQPLVIDHKAVIFQNSGEDWEKVNVILSSNNPRQNDVKPKLEKWVLGNIPLPKENPNRFQEIQDATGSGIKGIVVDEATQEPLPFVNVYAKQYGEIVSTVSTDFDGKFMIRPLPPGIYDIEIKFVGYQPKRITGIKVKTYTISQLKIGMNPTALELESYEVVAYKVPLISKDNTSSGGTFTMEDIYHMPGRSNQVIRGSRSSNSYFIDGIKVNPEIKNKLLLDNTTTIMAANIEVEIDESYTIPSNGEDYAIGFKESTLPCKFVYELLPRLDQDAFLSAKIYGWEELNLLSGKYSVFVEGTYTNEGFFDARTASDTLSLYLGRDNSITVSRELKAEEEKKVFGSTVKEVIGWEIVVKNNKPFPVNVIIYDQVPVMPGKNFKLEPIELSAASYKENSGKITWKFMLSEMEKQKLFYSYELKYPSHFYTAYR